MAARLRIGSRFRLARLLRQEGLPPFGRLADWICVLQIMWEADATRLPLHHFARRAGLEPATCYRRCKRVLGVPWGVACGNGFAWALLRFLNHCHRPAVSRPRRNRGAAKRASPSGPAQFPVLPDPDGRSSASLPVLQHVARAVLGQAPTDAVVSQSGAVYVCRAFAATVEHLDLATLRPVSSILVGCNPTRIALDPLEHRAFVSNQFDCKISVIDTRTDQVIDEIPVAGDPAPVLVASDGHTLYVTTNLDRLYALDLHRKVVVAEAVLPAASHHLVLHPDRKRLFVSTRAAGVVLEFDARTLAVMRSVGLGGQTQALALEARSGELYVANESGWLDVVNIDRGARVASLRLDAGAYGLSVSPDTRWLYVTLPSLGRVVVIERAALRVAHVIHTGGMPRHTVFRRDGLVALVVNEAGWLDVLRHPSSRSGSARPDLVDFPLQRPDLLSLPRHQLSHESEPKED